VFGRVATCGSCRAAHAYLDSNGCTYRGVDFGDPGANEMYVAAVQAAGQSPRSSISMPAIVSTGGGFAGEVTYGWSTSFVSQHHVSCR
jgi:glutaredoxin